MGNAHDSSWLRAATTLAWLLPAAWVGLWFAAVELRFFRVPDPLPFAWGLLGVAALYWVHLLARHHVRALVVTLLVAVLSGAGAWRLAGWQPGVTVLLGVIVVLGQVAGRSLATATLRRPHRVARVLLAGLLAGLAPAGVLVGLFLTWASTARLHREASLPAGWLAAGIALTVVSLLLLLPAWWLRRRARAAAREQLEPGP